MWRYLPDPVFCLHLLHPVIELRFWLLIVPKVKWGFHLDRIKKARGKFVGALFLETFRATGMNSWLPGCLELLRQDVFMWKEKDIFYYKQLEWRFVGDFWLWNTILLLFSEKLQAGTMGLASDRRTQNKNTYFKNSLIAFNLPIP